MFTRQKVSHCWLLIVALAACYSSRAISQEGKQKGAASKIPWTEGSHECHVVEGVSATASYDEALRDALGKLPTTGDKRFRFRVIEESGITGGITGGRELRLTVLGTLDTGNAQGDESDSKPAKAAKAAKATSGPYITFINNTTDLKQVVVSLSSNSGCGHYTIRKGNPITVTSLPAKGFGVVGFDSTGRAFDAEAFQLGVPFEVEITGSDGNYKVEPHPLE